MRARHVYRALYVTLPRGTHAGIALHCRWHPLLITRMAPRHAYQTGVIGSAYRGIVTGVA